jgi:arylformamidase
MDRGNKNIQSQGGHVRLSYTLQEDSPVHIGLNQLQITPLNQISRGGEYNTSLITVENHCGTHVDAPAHFLPEGRVISDYGPEELVFNQPIILNTRKNAGELVGVEDVSKIEDPNMDCLLICTGFGQYHDTAPETYLTQNPGISSGAVSYLRENFSRLACIGIDTVSMSRYGHPEEAIEIHKTAFMEKNGFGKPLLLVEDLDSRPLSEIQALEEVIVIPWQIEKIDSAPCTVLASIK